jgi:hypothetical protein
MIGTVLDFALAISIAGPHSNRVKLFARIRKVLQRFQQKAYGLF